MKLEIEAFRGINQPTEITFKNRCDLTIIYGENGSGKTTISDALDFLFHGSAGSLQEKSLDGLPKMSALVNSQREKKDLVVALTDRSETRRSTLQGSRAVHTGDLSITLRAMRRDLIAGLTNETPAKRFERIQDFVTIPALEQEEAELDKFIKESRRSRDDAQNNVTRAVDELKAFYEEACPPGDGDHPAQQEWIEMILKTSSDSQSEKLTILRDIQHELNRLRTDFTSLRDALKNLDAATEFVAKEDEALRKIAAESASDAAGAIDLLQIAQTYLEENAVDQCPICDTAKTPEELRASVSSKLSSLTALSQQNRKKQEADKDLDRKKTVLSTQQENFFSIIAKLIQVHQAANESGYWTLDALIPELTSPKSPDHLDAAWFAAFAAAAPQLTPLREWLESEVAKGEKVQSIRSRLQSLVEDRKRGEREFEEYRQLAEKAQKILDVFREERTNYANETLDSISGEFARLYESVHPGEQLEKIRLYLQDGMKGSAKLDGELHGKDKASPVAYLSESHLDTLGLCLFLALEKKRDPQNTVLYLDDAIASVDEAHMTRLYDLIIEEAEHFRHVIITSHYQPLRFKFRWGQLNKQNVDFVELGEWTLENGITMGRGPTSEIALLRKYVEAGEDSQAIAGKAGVVLEFVFDFLTGIYGCSLPRIPGNEQRWTLADYAGGLKRLNQKFWDKCKCCHLDEEGNISEEIPLKPLIDDLFTQLEARNCFGAHFKPVAAQFDEIAEAKKLGEATLALCHALCDSHDQLPSNKKDGTCWMNPGKTKTRQLHPLIRPV